MWASLEGTVRTFARTYGNLEGAHEAGKGGSVATGCHLSFDAEALLCIDKEEDNIE